MKGKLHGKSVEEMMKFGFQRGLMKNPISVIVCNYRNIILGIMHYGTCILNQKLHHFSWIVLMLNFVQYTLLTTNY